jgi:hypothetical protein
MGHLIRWARDEHFIDQGRVHCPVRGRDVDFDLCVGCRWSTGIDLDAQPPVVRCRPDEPPLWLVRPWF